MNQRIKMGAFLALLSVTAQAQLNVNTTLTPTQLVQEVLLGAGVSATNITYNGVAEPATAQNGTGSFITVDSNLGLPAGVILSSGPVDLIAAPASSFQSGQVTPSISDPDLFTIAGATINNAAVLEFDFIPLGDTIRFRYVFGSEEYPEWVCSQFNDAFGFFLSGPDIAGPYTNGAINLALLPGTNVPVSINTVNNGDNNIPSATCPAMNPEYYVINTGTTVVYDGMTVVLEAVSAVQCGQTYHIKLAIGDAGDTAFDSGVFLEAGSFTSVPFIPSLSPGPGIVGNNTILESCFPVQIDFTRTGDISVASTVTIEVGGTATPGVDYSPTFPASLDFPAGVESLPFIFNCPIDPDGTETIILTLTSPSVCAGVDIMNEFTFFIESAPALLATSFDQNIQCGDELSLQTEISGGYAPYSVSWGAAGTGNPITVSPTQFTVYTATVTDDCGVTTSATFNIGLIELPPINALIIGPTTVTEGCQTNQINIIRPVGVPGELNVNLIFSGTAQNGSDFDLPSSVVIGADNLNILVPFDPIPDGETEGAETVIVLVSFTDDCGRTVEAVVTITILDPPPILLTTEDYNRECVPDSLQIYVIGSGGFNNQLTYEWSNGATGSTTYVPLQATTTYVVTATDPCGNTATATVAVVIDCEVIVPNVFTPNGDGVNDVWFIEGILYQDNQVTVFNRWGQVVFESKNYRNTWAALDVPDGTYYYEVLVPKRPESPLTGHVTILRNRW